MQSAGEVTESLRKQREKRFGESFFLRSFVKCTRRQTGGTSKFDKYLCTEGHRYRSACEKNESRRKAEIGVEPRNAASVLVYGDEGGFLMEFRDF